MTSSTDKVQRPDVALKAAVLAMAVVSSSSLSPLAFSPVWAEPLDADPAKQVADSAADPALKTPVYLYQCSRPGSEAPAGQPAARSSSEVLQMLVATELPIEVSADELLLQADSAIYDGHVDVQRGPVQLSADRASLDVASKDIQLIGDVSVSLPGAQLSGSSATINLETNASMISDAEYFVDAAPALSGRASSVELDDKRRLVVLDGSYTRCDPAVREWQIEARKLVLDAESGQGSARGALLRILDQPVVYVPYFRFPVGDQRQSGLLFPSFTSRSEGIDFAQPYYFNLAPNYDLLLTPRYFGGHGYITETQSRWLNRIDRWQLSTLFIDSDSARDNDSRWTLRLTEQSENLGNFATELEINRVSDVDVLRDLQSSNFSLSRSSTLPVRGQLRWLGDYASAGVLFEQFQSIDPEVDVPYEKLPELWFEGFIPSRGWRPALSSELSYTVFDAAEQVLAGPDERVQRTAGKLALNYPLSLASSRLELGLGSEFRYYELEQAEAGVLNGSSADWINVLRADAHWSLDLWRADAGGREELLQPQLSYTYRALDSGAASIATLPQLDAFVASATLDDLYADSARAGDFLEGRDRARFALHYASYRSADNAVDADIDIDASSSRRLQTSLTVGAIAYRSNRRDQTPAGATGVNSERRWFLDAKQSLASHWLASSTLIWAPEQSQLALASAAVSYRAGVLHGGSGPQTVLNLGYHRRADSARFEQAEPVEQLDFSVAYPLAERWTLYGRYQYDQQNGRHSESLAGVAFEDCCFGLRLLYRDGLVYSSGSNTANRDRSLMLQLQLKGLGGVGSAVSDVLERSIRGYRAP